jgi:hypothetical protein
VDLTGATATQSSDYNEGNSLRAWRLTEFWAISLTQRFRRRNATWTLSLPAKTTFDIIRIWNRGDGCCQARLQDITVTAFDDPLGTNNGLHLADPESR